MEEWKVCELAIGALRQRGVEFLVGGAFGLGVYTRRLRDTKDIDLFTLPETVPHAVEALNSAGFNDYYSRLPYDRGWIYRSTRDGFIVDIIFKMANRRAPIDPVWFARAPGITLKNEKLRIIPAEELLWQKLYVLQRDRCDWPDVFNLLHNTVEVLDWEHLLQRLGPDLPLLRGAMQVFQWLCPERCPLIPEPIREKLGLELVAPPAPPGSAEYRASLLDSRRWFAPAEPAKQLLEV